jgi:putative RecB family exonuclease
MSGTALAPVAIRETSAHLALRLSPSRASDFKACPMRFKFKVVDHLTEAPTVYTARGTLVHAALEALFLLPPRDRTLAATLDLFEAARLEAVARGELHALFKSSGEEAEWAAGCRRVIANYFDLEDPARLEPVGRELRLEAVLPGTHVTVTGILDRVDRRDNGTFLVSDYKTGSPPALQYANKSFFGLVIYAWLFQQSFGVIPARLRLLYLDAPEVYRLDPDERKVQAMAGQLAALWRGVETAHRRDDWRTRPGPLCDYCSFRDCCPAWNESGEPVPVETLLGPVAGSSTAVGPLPTSSVAVASRINPP